MWGRKKKDAGPPAGETPQPLKEAVRQARVEAAERTGIVVDLRDAALARLEALNEALDPVFREVPADVVLFDRALSRGDTPRLWIDAVAFVEMGRDKRQYRFLQDTRFGRIVLSESPDVAESTRAITRYLAGRLVERERALSGDGEFAAREARAARKAKGRQRRRMFGAFLLGILFTLLALVAALWWAAP